MSVLIKNNTILTAGGKILQSREESPFDLVDLKMYLSATRMSQLADGTEVSMFSDFSGNAYNAVQNTVGYQPLFKTSQFTTFAGIKGDGVDDKMNCTGGALDIFNNVNEYTVQLLIKRTVVSTSGYALSIINNANTEYRFLIGYGTAGTLIFSTRKKDVDARNTLTFATNDTTTAHFIQATLNPTTNIIYYYVNGLLIGTDTLSSGNMNASSCAQVIVGNGLGGTTTSNVTINGISINTKYSDHATIRAQYRGYLQRGYL